MLVKVASGADKMAVKPKTWTFVEFGNKTKFYADKDAQNLWTCVLRVIFPNSSSPTTVRTRFVRYPGTSKHDETGHVSHPIPSSWAGRAEHIHFSHEFKSDPKMAVGVWVWHDGGSSIVLDGRQVKANPLA
jgi:hypothetical protein